MRMTLTRDIKSRAASSLRSTPVNRPGHAPPWPAMIEGVSFSPFRPNQSPEGTRYPSEAEIARDLDLLSDKVRSVRTYSTEGTLGAVPRLARERGMTSTVGVWISDDLPT